MFKPITLVIALLSSALFLTAHAQQSALPGSVKGIARDTAQNYVLKSATVSIFKDADSTLLSYQVTNNYGEFNFKNLPVNLPLKLEISHVGYLTTRKKFSIPAGKNTTDLQTLIVNRRDITLNEVAISVPPITINGDTLEFNAAAFKLDSNATVEDMLKKIPNITLWGDGQITVNGAEVKSLKVNGQDFFGKDPKIALQNISKNALQKVQVYNTTKDQSNPLDSTLEMNLKLKKGKDIGYFGKIGIGYGTNNHYEADASINMYTPKMQLALIGALNNINKMPNSINSLMANSTFKGVGTNVEYQPDFRTAGLNKPAAAGASLTYNFIENPTYEKKSTLKANYFVQNRNTDFLSEKLTTTTVNSADKIFENSNNINTASNTSQRFDSGYEFVSRGHNLNLSQSLNIDQREDQSQTFRTAGNLQNAVTSTNNTSNTSNSNNRSFNFNGNYRNYPYIHRSGNRFSGFTASYNLNIRNNESQRLNITEFKSLTDATSNRKFNRKYYTDDSDISQEVNLSLRNLKSLLFGGRQWRILNIDLTNKLALKSNKDDNRVQDLDTLTSNYRDNTYLTNRIQTNVIEETPGLDLQKTFSKRLSNRFDKSLTLNFHPKQILIMQDNKSDRSFQNIKKSYHKFAPDASISYNDHQYGEHSRYARLSYQTRLIIPSIQQLAPLTDSTNLYYLQRGNVNLKEATRQEISFSLEHYDQRNKNTLNYNFRISAGLIKNNIVDSLLIDDQNRRTVFLVNANGHKFLNFSGDIKKAFKLKHSELQFSLRTSIDANKNPGYTNNAFTFSSNFNTNSNLSINYTYKSDFAVVLSQSYSTYQSKQKAFNTAYSGSYTGTSLSSSYNVTKKFTLNSNIGFNSNASSAAKAIDYTIWNASAVYRFLKGNNAEIKFSALDLLRQNSSVINYGSANSFTIGTQNVLQQYFMTTISYYPRQFGKKGKVKK